MEDQEPEPEPERLNAQQFADYTNAGGASRRLSDDSVPTHGYMVSHPGMEWISDRPTTPAQVTGHREAINLFRRPLGVDATSYQGGWVEHNATRGADEIFHDHSKWYADRATAHKAARTGHQLGLYDVANQVTHPVDQHEWEGPSPVKNILEGSISHVEGLMRNEYTHIFREHLGLS